MHSNAAKDPYFIAKIRDEVKNAGNFEKECAKCHTPAAKIQAEKEGKEISLLGGFLKIDSEFYEFAIDGVSCSLCHQIKKSRISGMFLVEKFAKKPERVIYGPFNPAYGIFMYRESGYYPSKLEIFRKAEFCGNCHVLYTPTIEKGEIVGYFPEQMTFYEWKNSVYNPEKPCQVCHMKEEVLKTSKTPESLFLRDLRLHYFSGANLQILSILGDVKGAERAEEMLKSSANIEIIRSKLENDLLEVVVKIENKAGHKFPTGFPSKRAFIHFLVEDRNGVAFESGKVLEGKILGEEYPEKHYDVIDSEEEVQIYESVMQGKDGKATLDLLSAYGYLKDNRILPLGFNYGNAHKDTVSIGVEDENFEAGYDTVTYLVKKKLEKPLKIRVELLYQPIGSPFLETLHDTEEKRELLEKLKKVNLTTLVDSDEMLVE